jgi:N-acetylglutamate synthase-like GNAT family acetyltransferase
MNPSGYTVRRATIEDLEGLCSMWQASQLPAPDLEKALTEFQVAVSAPGTLAGAVGLRMEALQGWLHNETYSDYGLSDTLRPLLWERLQNVARSHGLCRLWTQESALFWKQNGFAAASRELIDKLPKTFGEPNRPWLCLQLRDDKALPDAIDLEFARLKETERERTDRLLAQAARLKWMATLLAIGLFVFVVLGSIYLLRLR